MIRTLFSHPLSTADAWAWGSYISSGGTAVYAWWNFDKIATALGLLIAGAAFVVNWYYRYKESKRKDDSDK